ncbi:DUF167 domain-containing protein [Staphylothermus hellenicus]|uniref:UPF0235 protein Shell_0270 n=1 Tax=Staphylothermus hellenicus (strain DSM 12710 / JCM 10830 / BK20S6-10-b1 / P8) TaxID=591019 RepID=D7DB61_STAHD|nr:DUF167 domain-containing protein [Staphylothermus hellenicus]ADI31408.1 protein of unknown function DUF167 [Staphylothermus hellenicus DSM 12710]
MSENNEVINKILKILQESREGVIIPIYVKPNSDRDALVLEGDELVFYTTEIPEKGRANAALIRFLSRNIRLPHNKIDIIYGARTRSKKVLVRDMEAEKLAEKLAEIISSQ